MIFDHANPIRVFGTHFAFAGHGTGPSLTRTSSCEDFQERDCGGLIGFESGAIIGTP